MAIGPREVMRSEVEGSLSGPANPLPEEAIDCGCAQMRCPRLAKFATRKVFLGLLGKLGLSQAAAQTYMYITSSTIARRFQIDPYVMDWILILSELTPFFLGLAVAYWGDRIHRAAWTGALAMLQAVGYFTLIIPHFTSTATISNAPENVTSTSLYADDDPELCSAGLARLITEEIGTNYITLFLLIIAQILSGAANVAFLALGISYMDDNTKKKRIPAFIGCFLGIKFIGVLKGCSLAWFALRIDAENLSTVESYKNQIGAWWLGWPALAIMIWIPGLLLSIFPRSLPSEMVEQAAASILDAADDTRQNPTTSYKHKVGNTYFFPSLLRLITNKVILFNVLAAVFSATAIINFLSNADIFLESRFHITRPTSAALGFGDPWTARLVVNILKPIIMGVVVIVSGLVIAKTRPRARYLAIYNVVVVVISAFLILSLIFATCDKPSIIGNQRNTQRLVQFCNRNCGCSRDAKFHPVCDINDQHTFYSPCHAGCNSTDYVDGEKVYGGCTCVVEYGLGGAGSAREGPCNSINCRIGWLIFQVGTTLVTALLASGFIGNLLINIRCIYPQDKALVIGFEMTWIALFAYLPGKLLYDKIADLTCQFKGSAESVCLLYDSVKLGDYLCYITVLLLALAAVFDALVWMFSKDLEIYEYSEEDLEERPTTTELIEINPLLNKNPANPEIRPSDTTDQSSPATTENAESDVTTRTDPDYESIHNPNLRDPQPTHALLKYGPLGPGNPRFQRYISTTDAIPEEAARMDSEDDLDSSSDDNSTIGRSNKNSEILYKPLDLESDVESDLTSTGPRSRRNVLSREFEPALNNTGIASFPLDIRNFPNPDHYENLKFSPPSRNIESLQSADSLSPVRDGPRESDIMSNDGFSKTNSFEFSNSPRSRKSKDVLLKSAPYRITGDFNEVGIPTVLPEEDEEPVSPISPKLKIQSIQRSQSQYQGHVSQEGLDQVPVLIEDKNIGNPEYNLDDVVAEPEVPPLPRSPPAHSLTSSGFGSLPDVQEKVAAEDAKVVSKSQESLAEKRVRPPPLNTDL